MAKTYDIACHDCKVTLWIGQGNRVYRDVEHLQEEQAFFFGHIGHHLEFNDSEVLAATYDFKSLDFDDEEEEETE